MIQLCLMEIYTEEKSDDSVGTMTFLASQLCQCHLVVFLWIAYLCEYSPSVMKMEKGKEEKILIIIYLIKFFLFLLILPGMEFILYILIGKYFCSVVCCCLFLYNIFIGI